MTPSAKDKLGADLSAYLDKELSGAQTESVEETLRTSNDARHLLEELRAVRTAVSSLEQVAPERDLTADILAQCDVQVSAQPHRMRIAPGVRRVLAVAASVLIIAVGIQFLTPSDSLSRSLAPQPSPQTAHDESQPLSSLAHADDLSAAEPGALAQVETHVDRVEPLEMSDVDMLGQLAKLRAGSSGDAADQPRTPRSDARMPEIVPDVDIVLQPTSIRTHTHLTDVVRYWPDTPPSARDALLGRFMGKKTPALKAAVDHREGTTYTLTMSPEQARELLAQLNEASPSDVRVAMSFSMNDLDRVRRFLGMPNEETQSDPTVAAASVEPPATTITPRRQRAVDQMKNVFAHMARPTTAPVRAKRFGRQAGAEAAGDEQSESDSTTPDLGGRSAETQEETDALSQLAALRAMAKHNDAQPSKSDTAASQPTESSILRMFTKALETSGVNTDGFTNPSGQAAPDPDAIRVRVRVRAVDRPISTPTDD